MINNPLPCKGLNLRIPFKFHIKGRGRVTKGSTLPWLSKKYSTLGRSGHWDVGLRTSCEWARKLRSLNLDVQKNMKNGNWDCVYSEFLIWDLGVLGRVGKWIRS